MGFGWLGGVRLMRNSKIERGKGCSSLASSKAASVILLLPRLLFSSVYLNN